MVQRPAPLAHLDLSHPSSRMPTSEKAKADLPSATLDPQAGFAHVVKLGAKKANRPTSTLFVLSVVSGAHVAMGACIALVVGHEQSRLAFGALGLPLALFMTVISGSELGTANMALVTAAFLDGAASARGWLKAVLVPLAGNVLGACLIVWLVRMSALLEAIPEVVQLAAAKVAMPSEALVSKAILCNWLVCMGAYMAAFATDVAGKAVAIWLPITSFAALGLEHTVANVFFLGAGWAHGAEITVADALLRNLRFVVVGNLIGALGGVALPFWFAYGRDPGKKGATAQAPLV